MTLAVEDEGELLVLAKKLGQLVEDLGDLGTEPDECRDFKEKLADATFALKDRTPAEALQAALIALEAMLQQGSDSRKAHLVKARLREILWLVKEAVASFKDAGDRGGLAVATQTLARVHLSRSEEADACIAALRCIKDSIAIFRELGDARREAHALRVKFHAHITKAGMTPFEKVAEEEIESALQATKDAAALCDNFGDKKEKAAAMHDTATILVGQEDEDMIFEGERYATEAMELFKECGERDLEVNAAMTIVNARMASSGPEHAALFAKDMAADWKIEGDRPKHEAIALHMAANVYLQAGETDDAIQLLKEAQKIFSFQRVASRRGVADVHQSMFQLYVFKEQSDMALQVGKEMAKIFEELQDKRAEGNAYLSMADLVLSCLAKEVEQDTQLASEKKEPVNKLTTDDVYSRGEEGLELAGKAMACFEEIGDMTCLSAVQELIQSCFQKAIDVYCRNNEPDRITTTLEINSPKEKESVLEWKIELPGGGTLSVGGDSKRGKLAITG